MLKPDRQRWIWALKSSRAGESSQILALAKTLSARFGWSLRVLDFSHSRRNTWASLTRSIGFGSLAAEVPNSLQPPWPDLVVSAGFNNEPIVRQIRVNSGGQTKLVMVGRTWAPHSCFDLIITTPQYRLPQKPNILQNLTTLHAYSEEELTILTDIGQHLWPSLDAPYLVVLIGGRSGPFVFGVHAARRLAAAINELATQTNASVLVTTSARTNMQAALTFKSLLNVPHAFYFYQKNCVQNPYPAMLAAASCFIVTGDSITMLSEAVGTGRPVYIFDVGAGRRTMRRQHQTGQLDRTFSTEVYRCFMSLAPKRLSRDITLVHELLVECGHAVWLDTPVGDFKAETAPPSALEHAVERVSALF